MKNLNYFLIVLILFNATIFSQQFNVSSPDGSIQLKISIEDEITFSVFVNSQIIIDESEISLELKDIGDLDDELKLMGTKENYIDEEIVPIIKEKFEKITNRCNEIILTFENNFSITFRVYDNGVAYRFETNYDKEITITDEEFNLRFAKNYQIYFPWEEDFFSHNERQYYVMNINDVDGSLCSLPALVVAENNVKVVILESDLVDYPGMWLEGDDDNTLEAVFPKYPKNTEQVNDRSVKVTKRECYIAKTNGTRTFPWRILAISKEDKELLTNQLVYILARDNQIEDVTWIKPGKVAWDWWNANNLFDVDFEPGLNTKTYKYYIDFAAKYGIEYVILDEGWYKLGNLFDVNPEINLEELIQYANEKNVGIILWVVWKTLDDQLTEALDWFERIGVKGIKVDFMQRDDQWMVNYYWKICEEAAKRKLLVDFHGAYKPTGLRRTFPNLVSREGVMGLEHLKWSDKITPEHNLTIPFIRMVAGHMDYTPGAMLNAHKENFQVSFKSPMSIGTRCHQLAMYIIYESQLQMLADSPSNYLKENECTEFISKIPVVWNETIVIDAKLGEYILIAKRSGEDWYIGGMTNSNQRNFEIDLSFLNDENYHIEIFQDGNNVQSDASDYEKVVKEVTKKDKVNINMYVGGGFAARIYLSEK